MSLLTIFKKTITLQTLLSFLVLGSLAFEAAGQRSPKFATRAPEASVVAIEIAGNPNCSDLIGDTRFANIRTNFQFKIDSPFSHGGPWVFQSSGNRELVGPTDLNNSVTTSGTSTSVNFTSTKAISAVIVNGGPRANVYYYANGTMGDTNLVVPQDSISNVTFCYFQPASVTIIKEVLTNPFGTSSTFGFGFTATGLGVPSFTLIDQDVAGPDRYIHSNLYTFAPAVISVTESLPAAGSGWTLADISCCEIAALGMTNVLDTTDDYPAGRTASIRLQPGENVVCVFRNTQLTPSAASVGISGRAVDSRGNGVSGAQIVLTDVSTGLARTTVTNPFGHYSIGGAEVGNYYVLSISHKRYTFADDTRTFLLTEELAGVDFVAEP